MRAEANRRQNAIVANVLLQSWGRNPCLHLPRHRGRGVLGYAAGTNRSLRRSA